jgi:micrococcal nuclease
VCSGLLKFTTFLVIWSATVAAGAAAEFSGIVDSVIDGDDIVLCDDDGSCRRIRLCGIDAPERKCPGYTAARRRLQELAEGNLARCVQVGGGTPCDGRSKPTSGKRIVAQCFVDGVDIASRLVEQGLACDWEMYSGGHYSRNGKGRLCPQGHREACMAVVP